MYRYTNHEEKKHVLRNINFILFFVGGGDFKVDYKNDIYKTFQKNVNKLKVQYRYNVKLHVSTM